MKKIFTLLVVFLTMTLGVNAKYLLPEGFETKTFPTDTILDCNNTSIPYSYSFDDEDLFECWQVIDANNDSHTFNYNDGNVYCSFNSFFPADDWLISPTFTLTGNEICYFDYRANSSNYPERFQVFAFGTDTIALTDAIDVTSTIYTTQYINLSGLTGAYQIAIHCISDADMFRLYITNFNVTNSLSASVTVDPQSIDFGIVPMNSSSYTQAVMVTAINVNEPITVTTAAPFEVSADGITYSTSLSIPANTAVVSYDTLYVRYSPTTAGMHNQILTIASSSNTDTVFLTGESVDCSGSATIPIFEGFENDIDCWTMISMSHNNDGLFGIFNDSDIAYEGDNCFRFSSYISAMDYNQYLITPELTLSADTTYILQFYYKGYRTSDKFKVMYSTTNNDISSFISIYDFETVPTSWTQASFVLPSGTKYVAFNYYGNFAYYLYVDNFSIGQITAPTVTISGPTFVQTGAATQFIAESQLADTFVWTVDGTTVPSTTDTLSYTFSTTGTHTVSVTVSNTVGSTTATHTVEVYSCDEVQTLPFFEDFEDDLSACWQNIDNDGDGHYWTPSSQFAAHTGNGMIYSASYINNIGALSPDNWLITPAVNLSTNATLSFWVCAQDDRWAGEHYGVYISTTGTDTTDFTLLFEETLDNNSGAKTPTPWKQKSFNLSEYTGQTVRIAFRHFNCYDKYYLNIDDIEISDIPSITVAPNTLNINAVSGGQGTATATVNGLNLTNGITATTTAPFAVSSDGITFNSTTTLPSTGGTLFVQYSSTAVGSENGTVTLSSTGASNETITLIGNAHDVATLPYSVDFEDADENARWMIVSGNPNSWVIGTAANYTEEGEYALYVSNDNGTTNAYTNTTASVSWAYRDIDFGQFNEYHLAFDFKGYGENNYDYLKIYLGDPTEVSETSYDAPAGATLLGTLSGISDWTHYTVTLPSTFSGLQRLYLLWRNDGNVGTNPPAAIDNLTLVGSNCVSPDSVTISNVTPYTADFSFIPASDNDFTWEYALCTDTQLPDDMTPVVISNTQVHLTELESGTTYNIYVRTVCNDNEFSDWSNVVTFTTIPTCTAPTNLSVSQITGTSALVTWESATTGASGYVVSYTEADQENWISETVSDHQLMLSGLTPMTAYLVTVTSVCAEGDAPAVSMNFNTHCLAGGEFTIGDGTTTNNYIPSYSFYKYGYSQQIFTAEELNGPSEITYISLNLANLSQQRNFKIYLSHTTAADLDSAWASTADAQLVYSGPQTLTAGWNTFNFTTPFSYNGTDNLLVIFVDSTGSYVNGNSWYVHSTPSSYARYLYQDASAYPLEPASSTSGTAVTVRNNVIFGGECDETVTCIAPNVYLSDITSQSLTLNWVAGNTESSWEMEYCSDTANWISAGIVSSSPYTIGNLDALTNYTVRMRSVCGNGEFSDWKTLQAATSFCDASEQCAYIFNLIDSYGDGWNNGTLEVQQNGVTVATLGLASGSSATETVNLCDNIPTSLVWHAGSYAYEAGFSLVSPYGEEIYSISGMTNFSAYTFTSRCDAPNCPSPVKNSVVASGIDGHNATINFTDNDPDHNSWTVYYRAANASQEDSWMTEATNNTTVSLSNLTVETTYDVYVITNCTTPDDIPDATYTVQFTTLESCLAPENVTLSNIGITSATVTWSSNADSFTIEYGEAGFNPGEGTIATTTNTFYTISNLAPATSYTVYVTADCGVEGTSSPTAITFSTTLTPVGLPYTTDFGADADQNWQLNNGTCTNHWMMGALPESSSNALFITSNDTTPGYNITSTSVVSAAKMFTVGNATQFRISFDVMVGGESSYDYLKLFFAPATEQYPASTTSPTASDYGYNVYSAYAYDFSDYMYASTSSSNIAYKFNLTDSNVVHIDALMPNPNENPDANSTAQVVFVWKNDFSMGTQPGAIISNVSVSVVSCPIPEDVHAVSATSSSIELEWMETGSATTWEIVYGAPGFNPEDATTVLTANTNTFEINGLSTLTAYDFYVRALCGGSDVSTWSNVLTATTTMEPVNLPYTTDFSDPDDAWHLNNGSCDNYWMMGTVDNENALFVTTDSTTPGYNITSTSVISAQKLFTVGTSPTVTISYDVMVGGEGNYDYLKMFLTPATMEFPASTTAPDYSDYAHISYSDHAYDFYTNNYGTNASHHYILNLVDSTIHVQATMANPNANPDANSTALLAFVWKNDGSVGTQPAAIIKNLTVTPAHTVTDEATICANLLPYEWNGVIFTEGGTQTASLQAEDGSDSVVTMILTVNEVYAETESKYLCPNELPYEWNGVTFTAAGTQIVTLTAANGCDSVVTMMLYINPTYTVTDSRTICQGELPYEWNGVTFTAAGAQIATLETVNGCDSVVVMSLTVNEAYFVNETVALCPSELPYVWNGLTFTESGTQSITVQTIHGCDSVLTMTVTVNSGYTVTETMYVCPSELPYEWNGVTFTAAGIQNVTLTAADGCDSVVTMVLNINPTYMVTDTRTICPSELPYEWNGVTFTAAGVQASSLQTINGCDSVVVMTLTVHDAVTSEFTIETSDSCYEWNGQIYCSSGDYTQTFTASNGCDSVATLHLTTNVGVVSHEPGTSLYLAPNPTKNISRIVGLSESLKYVDVMDMRGRLVLKSFDNEIDVSTLPAGVYVVKVFTDSGVTNLKLVKQ